MSAYPPALKTVLKAAPCILMCLGMSTLTWVYMHGLVRHSQDHVPKHTYRSTRFERLVRFRDQRNRQYLEPALTYNPNVQNHLQFTQLP